MDEAGRRALEDLKVFEGAFLSLQGPGRDDEMLRRLKAILFRVQLPP